MTRDFSRQSFLGSGSETAFSTVRVGLAGLGGGGSHIVQQLAHVGIQHYVVADGDLAENSNLNRLVGAKASDVGFRRPKGEIAQRLIVGLNPLADIVVINGLWQQGIENLRACNVIFGCLDSYLQREELERFCRRFLIPYIDIGMDVHEYDTGFRIVGQVAQSFAGEPCLRCMGIINDHRLRQEAELYGAAGARPQVVWPNGVLASTAVSLFVRMLTSWGPKEPTVYLEYNGNDSILQNSPRLKYVVRERCSHYSDIDLGDRFYEIHALGQEGGN